MDEIRHYIEEGDYGKRHVLELPAHFVDEDRARQCEKLALEVMSHRGVHLRIDFQHVRHMSSTALGALITILLRARRLDGTLKMDLGDNQYVRNLFKRIRLPIDLDGGGLAGVPDAHEKPE